MLGGEEQEWLSSKKAGVSQSALRGKARSKYTTSVDLLSRASG